MYICQNEFEHEDPSIPGYSLNEIDVYSWIPSPKARAKNVENHRLSLRKNLRSGEFEVYRQFSRPDRQEVAFHSKDLKDCLEFMNTEWETWHGTPGYKREADMVCQHVPGKMSMSCIVSRRAINRIRV